MRGAAFARMTGVVLAASASWVACSARPLPAVSTRGPVVTQETFTEFDAHFDRLLTRYEVPGCAVAVTFEGRLVYEQGYGRATADPAAPRLPVRTRFRIASLTKPITAVGVHRLVELGRLDLDARVLPLLGIASAETTPGFDARWQDITVRHLLEHSAGWDREISFDPMFGNFWIAKTMGREPPLDLDALIEFMLGVPLDFAPGERYAYSNFGYALLGRVIETVTGVPYDRWIREQVLAPMGITGIELGRSRPQDRPPDETAYFPDDDDPWMPNLFSREHELVSPADGGFAIEPMAAHGGLIASAADYARFLVHVDGAPEPPDLLSADSMRALLDRPTLRTPHEDPSFFYAHGFWVEELGRGRRIWHHTGAKPGTSTFAVRDHLGFSYVALCNGRPLDGDFHDDLDATFTAALATVRRFPTHDLFRAP